MGHKCGQGIEYEGSMYDSGIPPDRFYDSNGELLPDAEKYSDDDIKKIKLWLIKQKHEGMREVVGYFERRGAYTLDE